MISKVPVFMRDIARATVPFGFHGPMKNDMKELGIDHTKYGHN